MFFSPYPEDALDEGGGGLDAYAPLWDDLGNVPRDVRLDCDRHGGLSHDHLARCVGYRLYGASRRRPRKPLDQAPEGGVSGYYLSLVDLVPDVLYHEGLHDVGFDVQNLVHPYEGRFPGDLGPRDDGVKVNGIFLLD